MVTHYIEVKLQKMNGRGLNVKYCTVKPMLNAKDCVNYIIKNINEVLYKK
jgi:hypothetical protein